MCQYYADCWKLLIVFYWPESDLLLLKRLAVVTDTSCLHAPSFSTHLIWMGFMDLWRELQDEVLFDLEKTVRYSVLKVFKSLFVVFCWLCCLKVSTGWILSTCRIRLNCLLLDILVRCVVLGSSIEPKTWGQDWLASCCSLSLSCWQNHSNLSQLGLCGLNAWSRICFAVFYVAMKLSWKRDQRR